MMESISTPKDPWILMIYEVLRNYSQIKMTEKILKSTRWRVYSPPNCQSFKNTLANTIGKSNALFGTVNIDLKSIVSFVALVIKMLA